MTEAEYNNKEKEGQKLKAYAVITGMIIAAAGIIAGFLPGIFQKPVGSAG